jgi:hypothetical protein
VPEFRPGWCPVPVAEFTKQITKTNTVASASELYRPRDRRLSAKSVPTFAGCRVVSAADPLHNTNLGNVTVPQLTIFTAQSPCYNNVSICFGTAMNNAENLSETSEICTYVQSIRNAAKAASFVQRNVPSLSLSAIKTYGGMQISFHALSLPARDGSGDGGNLLTNLRLRV